MKKFTTKTFIKKSIEKHGHKYDYSNSIYIHALKKVEIICPTHGSFFQIASNHYNRGQGCPECKFEVLSNLYKKPTQQFIKDAIKIHNNFYKYSEVDYKNSFTKVEITCPNHGSFFQTPDNHINRSRGCPKCNGGIKLTKEEFIKKAVKIHSNKYKYSKVDYKNSISVVEIICTKHGSFFQKPNNHLSGSGCGKCTANKSNVSQIWLDSLEIKELLREEPIYVNNKKFIVDGLDPATNTIYEYNGSFWHGNPFIYNPDDINNVNGKTFRQLFQKTLNKRRLLEKAGYKVVSKWGP